MISSSPGRNKYPDGLSEARAFKLMPKNETGRTVRGFGGLWLGCVLGRVARSGF